MAGGTDPEDGAAGPAAELWELDPDLVPHGKGKPPLFLARDLYRRRRIMDAARLLPLFGTVLVLLPILWAKDHGTARGLVYLFVVWAMLVVGAALLARHLSEPLREDGSAGRTTPVPPAGPDHGGDG